MRVLSGAIKRHPNDSGIVGKLAHALLRNNHFTEYADLIVDGTINALGGILTEEKRDEIRWEPFSMSSSVEANHGAIPGGGTSLTHTLCVS
jgi:hypothetical protein